MLFIFMKNQIVLLIDGKSAGGHWNPTLLKVMVNGVILKDFTEEILVISM